MVDSIHKMYKAAASTYGTTEKVISSSKASSDEMPAQQEHAPTVLHPTAGQVPDSVSAT